MQPVARLTTQFSGGPIGVLDLRSAKALSGSERRGQGYEQPQSLICALSARWHRVEEVQPSPGEAYGLAISRHPDRPLGSNQGVFGGLSMVVGELEQPRQRRGDIPDMTPMAFQNSTGDGATQQC